MVPGEKGRKKREEAQEVLWDGWRSAPGAAGVPQGFSSTCAESGVGQDGAGHSLSSSVGFRPTANFLPFN